jgi:hypothetical protein
VLKTKDAKYENLSSGAYALVLSHVITMNLQQFERIIGNHLYCNEDNFLVSAIKFIIEQM